MYCLVDVTYLIVCIYNQNKSGLNTIHLPLYIHRKQCKIAFCTSIGIEDAFINTCVVTERRLKLWNRLSAFHNLTDSLTFGSVIFKSGAELLIKKLFIEKYLKKLKEATTYLLISLYSRAKPLWNLNFHTVRV